MRHLSYVSVPSPVSSATAVVYSSSCTTPHQQCRDGWSHSSCSIVMICRAVALSNSIINCKASHESSTRKARASLLLQTTRASVPNSDLLATGLKVLAKNWRNCCREFARVRPQSRKNDFSEMFLGQKCVIPIEMSNSRISCTVNGERTGFYRNIVGFKMTLHFWNKHQQIDLVFMQLARYN